MSFFVLKTFRFCQFLSYLCSKYSNFTIQKSLIKKNQSPELKTLEWWISGLMLNPLFFLISRLNIACSPLIFNLQIIIGSGLKISHSKVFSSEVLIIGLHYFLSNRIISNNFNVIKSWSAQHCPWIFKTCELFGRKHHSNPKR